MKFIDREELRIRMNRYGREHIPFVWCISYDGSRCFIVDSPFDATDVLWEVRGVGNSTVVKDALPPELKIEKVTDYDTYADMFSIVRKGIMRGDSFLANLTAATEVGCSGSLRDIFHSSHAPYKLLIDDEFVCFSPEPFVTVDNGRISTFPMKGTIDATIAGAEQKLLDSYKETCEHYTIVDLMRNDLNIVSEDVEVVRFRYIDRIATTNGEILQTSSEIRGGVRGCPYDFGDIILPLLPAGSITGAPKPATVELIERAEKGRRGWYTGVFGFYDGRVMQTAVMIRCIQRSDDGRLYFHSGGGITVNSDCKEEYDELIAKIYLTK